LLASCNKFVVYSLTCTQQQSQR